MRADLGRSGSTKLRGCEPIRCDGSHGPNRTSHRSPRSARAVPFVQRDACACEISRHRVGEARSSELRRQDGSPRWAAYGLSGGARRLAVVGALLLHGFVHVVGRDRSGRGAALRDDRDVVRARSTRRRSRSATAISPRRRRSATSTRARRASRRVRAARRSWARGSTRRTRPGTRPPRCTCRARSSGRRPPTG